MQRYSSSGASHDGPRRRLGGVVAGLAACLVSTLCVTAAALLLPAVAAAQGDWLATPALQAQLAAGRVVVRGSFDKRHARANIDAAIRVHAAPQSIWKFITQCRYAKILIPGLRRCRQLRAAADGSWEIIEHDIKYAPLLPLVHSIFRADLRPPLRMDFHRVAGDLKDETGSWILQPGADGTTTVEYRVSIKPGFWVPRSMVRRSLRKQLPAALMALRSHAEAQPAASVAAASTATEAVHGAESAVPASGGDPSGGPADVKPPAAGSPPGAQSAQGT